MSSRSVSPLQAVGRRNSLKNGASDYLTSPAATGPAIAIAVLAIAVTAMFAPEVLPMKNTRWLVLGCLTVVFAACGAEPETAEPEGVAAPNFGGRADSATSGDVADNECLVVLREVHRLEDVVSDSDEYGHVETIDAANCTDDGRCWQVFEGTFDVEAELASEVVAEAGVLYRSREGDYYTVAAEPTDGAVAGYQRFAFRLDENTIVDNVPAMTAARAHLELIPYVQVGRSRIFDHNLHQEVETNYELDQAGEWGFRQRADVCPALADGATLRFFDDFSHEQDGDIVPGGQLTIEYDLARLPQCQDSWHNGTLSWQTGVSLRFLPDETIVRRQLMVVDGAEAVPTPATIFVPTDAESVEMWFHTSGTECETAYDSNLDQNYQFEVAP